jgi:hypothetical protein
VLFLVLTFAAQSWSSKVNSPLKEVEGSPGSRGFTGGFQSKLMLKVCTSELGVLQVLTLG